MSVGVGVRVGVSVGVGVRVGVSVGIGVSVGVEVGVKVTQVPTWGALTVSPSLLRISMCSQPEASRA